MDFSVIIPARYASTRLSAKLLRDIHGKPLIHHTYENAKSKPIRSAHKSIRPPLV
jgi:3-deoxy-manno-octulosonate cytidylyltransferase (CMP-KDO synthetase)